ncbi:MAG: hypothetical protein QXR53_03425 [Candidatus Norongarragalinales archaeon]
MAVKFNKKLFAFIFASTLLFDILLSTVSSRSVGYYDLIVLALLFSLLGTSLSVGEKK